MIESLLLFLLLACPHPEIEYVPGQFHLLLTGWLRSLEVYGPAEECDADTRLDSVREAIRDCARCPTLDSIDFLRWPTEESIWDARRAWVVERDRCLAIAEVLHPESYVGRAYAQHGLWCDRVVDAYWDVYTASNPSRCYRARRVALAGVREMFGEAAMRTGCIPGTLPPWP